MSTKTERVFRVMPLLNVIRDRLGGLFIRPDVR